MNTSPKTPPNQGSLFTGAPQSLDLDAALRRALKAAFRDSRKSRQTIADEISQLTARHVTVRMLNDFSAESHSKHRFPAAWLPAFCVAVGDSDVMRLLVSAAGFQMIDADEAMLIEYARATLEKKEAAEKIDELEPPTACQTQRWLVRGEMTPLETILIMTPEAMRLEEMQEEIKFMRRGIRELVRARVPLKDVIAEVRRQYVAVAIDEAGGNQSHAALVIGTARSTVLRNMPRKPARKPPYGATALPETQSAKGGAA